MRKPRNSSRARTDSETLFAQLLIVLGSYRDASQPDTDRSNHFRFARIIFDDERGHEVDGRHCGHGRNGTFWTSGVAAGPARNSGLVLYLIPATSVTGAIFLNGYIGGAIVTHLRIGEPVYMQIALSPSSGKGAEYAFDGNTVIRKSTRELSRLRIHRTLPRLR